MGLLNRLFGGRAGAGADADASGHTQPQSSQFHESETTAQLHGPKNAPRRELVQVVLRDTMRKHGIPSDWIDCRVLSVVTRQHQSGMHVQFIVCKGQTRLLNYVHEFQESFWEEIEKFEPQARDWLFSLAWQFDGGSSRTSRSMPTFGADAQASGDTQPSDLGEDDLESDLQALYAIRDAALAQPEPPTAASANRTSGPARS
jgi:hypothetical protein